MLVWEEGTDNPFRKASPDIALLTRTWGNFFTLRNLPVTGSWWKTLWELLKEHVPHVAICPLVLCWNKTSTQYIFTELTIFYPFFFLSVKLRFFSNRHIQLLWQQSLLRVIHFHVQGLEVKIKWCSTFCHLLLKILCFGLAEQPQQTVIAGVGNGSICSMNKGKAESCKLPALLSCSLGTTQKKGNRTFQQHLKLIVFIWNNVIYFCQRESFRASTACLRVLQFWRPYPGKPGFCFNKDFIIHPEALGPTAAASVYDYSMKNTFCCTRLPYCLLWVKLQVLAICILPCPTSKDFNQNLNIAFWYEHGKTPKAIWIKFGTKQCSESII